MPDKNKHKPSPLTKPLSMKRFRKELKSATRYEFRPLRRELNKQTRISKLESQNTNRYFRDYKRSIGQAIDSSQQGYDQAQQAGLQYAAAAGQRSTGLQGQLAAEQQQNASLYGGTASTGAQNLAAAGSASQVQAGGEVASAIQAVGANTRSSLAKMKSNANLAKVEALAVEKANRDQISSDKQALIRERADFRNNYLAQAREGERQYELALKELRNANRQAAKDRNFSASEAAKDRKASKQSAQADAGAEKDGAKADRKKAYNKALALLGGYANPNKISKNPKQAIAGLVNEGIPAGVARRAVHQWLKKHADDKGGGKGKGGKDDLPDGGVWGDANK